MATYNDANIGGILAAEAIPQYARVFLNASGKGELAAITERDIGTAENDVFADGDDLTIRWRNAQGTRKCIAAGAIAVGAEVHTAASGKLNDVAAATSIPYGIAMSAAGADGDIFEVLPYGGRPAANP
jgi:hypothetical protein